MKPINNSFAYSLGIATFLIASSVLAQPGAMPGRNYNTATVQTLQGKVIAIDQAAGNRRGGMGVHFTLQTDKETIPVHVGPFWYMKKQSLQIEMGDAIAVTGSRVTLNGKPAIIAAEIRRAKTT